jgi:hypothetical protein
MDIPQKYLAVDESFLQKEEEKANAVRPLEEILSRFQLSTAATRR